jgi:ABC-type multidrug transport system fused ATPase/permease subunit
MGYKKLTDGTIFVAGDGMGSVGVDLTAPGGAGPHIAAIPAQDNAAIWRETLRYNILYEACGYGKAGIDSEHEKYDIPDDDAIVAVLRVLRWSAGASSAKSMSDATAHAAARDFLAASALDAVIDPARLSSGEKQRVLLARALLSGKSVLVMDEGTSALPPDVEADAWALLRRTFSSIVLVSHQLRDIQRADYLVGMQDGTFQEAGTPAALLAMRHSLLRHCFRVADGGLSSRFNIRSDPLPPHPVLNTDRGQL